MLGLAATPEDMFEVSIDFSTGTNLFNLDDPTTVINTVLHVERYPRGGPTISTLYFSATAIALST